MTATRELVPSSPERIPRPAVRGIPMASKKWGSTAWMWTGRPCSRDGSGMTSKWMRASPPVPGGTVGHTSPTFSTPGYPRRASRSRSLNGASWSIRSTSRSSTKIAKRSIRSVRKPTSLWPRDWYDRSRRPAVTTSTVVSAISPVTSHSPNLRSRRSVTTPRPPPRNVVAGSTREIRMAGIVPANRAVRKRTDKTNAKVVRVGVTVTYPGTSSGAMRRNAWSNGRPATIPMRPPAVARRAVSAMTCLIRWARPAPIAARTANSRRCPNARTTSSPATLLAATSNKSPAAPSNR